MKYYIQTLGCKVNNYDSWKISNGLESLGYYVSPPETADIVIVNSCAVTSESVRKTRQYINKLKIGNNCFLILIGCASILDQFKNNKNIDLICNKENVIDIIKDKFKINKDIDKKKIVSNFHNKTRFFMKIEDGCENFCSYCIIPFTRGKIKSKGLEEIECECKQMSKFEFKEIVLTGINLGKYGKDLNLNIIDAIKVARKYFKRIRLSSLEPDVIDDKLINDLSLFPEICPSFHLSLQSGSDKILRSMNRKYDSSFYLNLIYKIRNKFKNATFTTDLIVGYPGENDKDFEDSIEIIRKSEFIKVNVFPFSPRPFTAAEKLNQIDANLKKQRAKYAIEFSKTVSKNTISKFFGQKFKVLFESKLKNDIYSGYSENYIKINLKHSENLCEKIKEVIFIPDMS